VHEPFIVDVSSQDAEENIVVDVIKAPFDVSLDEPDRSFPRFLDFSKCRMATTVRPETVRLVTESRFKVSLCIGSARTGTLPSRE
jgi:hypothetical protein